MLGLTVSSLDPASMKYSLRALSNDQKTPRKRAVSPDNLIFPAFVSPDSHFFGFPYQKVRVSYTLGALF